MPYVDFNTIQYPFPALADGGIDDLIRKNALQEIYWNVWEKCFDPGDTVYDIGAHIGTTSIPLAILGGIVHAFEGSQLCYDRLEENCAPLRAITVHKVALHELNKTCNTRFNDCIGTQHPVQLIKYVRLDDYVSENNVKDPDFIKMDIEGMESIVLKTMRRFIEEVKPITI
ncbi:MAG: FkbM family methyltransferase [Planctomycetes bacterium]|nr:FkbM family methyltransferase [Planctomycetota bacterium]